jgi:hypothetical protein
MTNLRDTDIEKHRQIESELEREFTAGHTSSTKSYAISNRYVVKDEHTLGYEINPTLMGVLAGSIIKGGHDWKNGPVPITPGHTKLRPAKEADFHTFRVVVPIDFKDQKADELQRAAQGHPRMKI